VFVSNYRRLSIVLELNEKNTTSEIDEIIYFEPKFLQNTFRLTAITRGCKHKDVPGLYFCDDLHTSDLFL
jgi:hypothetical protein